MKSETNNQPGHVSIYDTIEHLQISTQQILSKCDKKLEKQLSHIFHQWERTLNYLISEKQAKDFEISELKEKYFSSKNTELKLRIKLTQKKSKETEMIKEIQAIKDHLEEGKEMWAKQITKIEEVMQEQERSKQKLESLYQQRLNEIDSEIDDIIHIHKKKLDQSQNLEEILPGLFSQEELQEERKIALGEISNRKNCEIVLKKLENASEYDIHSENSLSLMNFEDLKGTEKLVFERLLELRKKLYKFRHEETTCSENSLSGSLPLELKSMSDLNIAKIESAFCRTAQFVFKEKKDSDSFSDVAGIVFGVSGSEKYRAGLTDLLKSEKLSISEREKIVYNLINGQITDKMKTVTNQDIIQQEDWGDMSSIHGETKEIEISQDLEHIFSKASIEFSKASLDLPEIVDNDKQKAENSAIKAVKNIKNSENFERNSENFEKNSENFERNSENFEKILEIFEKPVVTKKNEADITKEAEFSEMSIIKDFSKYETNSNLRKMSDDSKVERSVEEPIQRRFSIDQREPSSSLILPSKTNLFFLPEVSRPRSNPRVSLKPEENTKPKNEPCEEVQIFPLNKPDARKPISMNNKLPVPPKPPAEVKKLITPNFRVRSLQPIQSSNVRIAQSPPTKISNDNRKSASPSVSVKFRMRRFKEVNVAGVKSGKPFSNPTKPMLSKKNNK